VFLAAAALPVVIAGLIVCRPELRGRKLRARLITPGDVRRMVFTDSSTLSAVLRRFRT
jgi:hypothetical protein